MSETDFHSSIGSALSVLIDGLEPFFEQVFTHVLPPSVPWTELLRRKDATAGRQMGGYRPRDLSLMLRAMTERLGDQGYPFNRLLSRAGQNYASELRQVRNRWAHNEEFSAPEAYRAIDSVELLLREVGAIGPAEAAARLKAAVSPLHPKLEAPLDPSAAAERAETESAQPESTVRFAPSPAEPPPPATRPTAIPGARLAIHAISDLSYPMAHCRIPVVDHIVVDEIGREIRGAVLQVDVVSASGSHGGPRELHADLAPDQPTTLRAVNLLLDPAAMLTVDDPRPGRIEAVLRDATGDVVAQTSINVNILASDQWKATPLQLGLEMLAAHVQPNAAAISALMTDVSNRLKASTGRSAIDGYQSDNAERVDAIAEAIYETMRARDIRYAEPPASWGLNGQKVRSPTEVLDGRLATCLDTAVTMAAALEQAGVNSTLWMIKGHALLGYWRIDSALPAISTTEVVDVVNLVDLGHLRLVETTKLTGGDQSASFSDALDAPRAAHVGSDLSNILGVTDIRQARLSEIFPLPSRTVNADGTVLVTNYTPTSAPIIAPYQPSESRTKPATSIESIPPRVAKWKNALLDLSLRNKLINYSDRSGYRLEIPGPAIGRFEDAVNDSARIALLAADEVKEIDVARGVRYGRDLSERDREVLLADKQSAYIDITETSYQGKLRRLAYKARTIVEETGANNLYLTFGMLSWRLDDRELRSPLVLVPVTISTTNRGERYTLTLDEAGMSTPNYCLIEKLRVTFGLDIPELNNPAEDASGIDLNATFDAVRRAITRAGLHFRVEETVHLAILQFAKFPLWKDLDDSWKALSNNSLVSHLIKSYEQPYSDPVVENTNVDLDKLGDEVPWSADSSQLHAIAEAAAGRTFVLEGPPGTGKSQTITNLLAHAMAAGRRVLFVAEKRAALDVVKKRLEAVGLGDLSLDLHDKSSRPAVVREQIRAALDLRVSADTDSLRTRAEAAESARNALARYARRLHEENGAGLSLYSARTSELAADQHVTPIDVPQDLVANGSPEAFEVVQRIMRKLPEITDLARPAPDHPWAFIDELPQSELDAATIHRCATEFDAALTDAVNKGVSIESLGRCAQPADFDTWIKLCGSPRHPLPSLDAIQQEAWAAELKSIRSDLLSLAENPPEWHALVSLAAVDLDIPAIYEAAVAADESGLFGRKKRRRAVLDQLSGVLLVDPKSIKLKSLTATIAPMTASHAAVAALRGRIGKLPIRVIDEPWNPLEPKHAATARQELASARWAAATLSTQPTDPHTSDFRSFYATHPVGALSTELGRIAPAWTALAAATGGAAEGEHFISQWWATRARRALHDRTSIDLWIDLLRLIEPLKSYGMSAARTAILSGEIDSDDASLAFNRGLAMASVEERRHTTALGSFNAEAHDKTIARYTTSLRAIRGELPRAIPAALLEKRRFDANAASGQIGKLRRQLDRRRGGMSVRGLVEHFGELIVQIMPCVLISPDSVARFFPAVPELFDIVVFDEASQIRVADAIGAMGRSRSVVVVGDSKQMPPTSFAEVSANVDDEETSDEALFLDEESILTECVHTQVPQQWLSWHYRSQDEALIAFSNQHYYNRRLASFPAPRTDDFPTVGGQGISLKRVNGVFERGTKGKTLRTNRVEADAIVADIVQRFQRSPLAVPSLGVITFNAQQRDLIENLLRDSTHDRVVQALDEPDGLFVKNLENVQGDERDTILFSIAFSANNKGVVPLNFGPLSRPGGERRLNVAITRARREVVLYASFDPDDLRANETFQTGTKHLKAYLQMAADGVEADGNGYQRMPVIDRHRDDIAAALRDEGVIVATDLGLSDFRVDLVLADPSQPGRQLVAVLLDGQNWHERRTVSDRDALPIDVLQKMMRWPAVERVWLPEWLRRREHVVAQLKAAVAAARERVESGDPEEQPTAPKKTAAPLRQLPPPTRTEVTAKPKASQKHPMLQPYREWKPGRLGDITVLDDLPIAYAKSRVYDAIISAMAVEAPIHPHRLTKIVAAAFDLTRLNENRRRSILQLVPVDYRRRDSEDFYWPVGIEPEQWRIVRQPPPGVSRQLDHVSLIEIGNAMLVVAEQTGGIEAQDLKREALSLFGSRRVTQGVGVRLNQALADALRRGVLRQNSSGLIVTD